jgi:hypothetical protein
LTGIDSISAIQLEADRQIINKHAEQAPTIAPPIAPRTSPCTHIPRSRSIRFVTFRPLFRNVPHATKYIDRKEGHAPLLVRAEGLIERLPRTSELLEVG